MALSTFVPYFLPACKSDFLCRKKIKDFRTDANQSIHLSLKLFGDFQNFTLIYLSLGNFKER